MDPQSCDDVFGVMEVWVGSKQPLKHLEEGVEQGKKDINLSANNLISRLLKNFEFASKSK